MRQHDTFRWQKLFLSEVTISDRLVCSAENRFFHHSTTTCQTLGPKKLEHLGPAYRVRNMVGYRKSSACHIWYKKTVDITVGGGQKLTLAWELLGRDVQNQTILSDGNRMSIQKI